MRKILSLILLATGLAAISAEAEDGMSAMSPADKALHASMMKMDEDMKMQSTGNADKDFVVMMIPHHQGAVDMAKVELQYGTDPELRKLAATIIEAQKKEIAQMKAWETAHSSTQQ